MGVPYTPQQTVATPGGIALIASSTLTRPSNTTAYAQYDLVANSTTAASVVATELPSAVRNNEGIRIEGLTLRKSSTTLTNASFRVYLFNSNPGTFTVGDNAAFNSSGALGIPTVSGLIGYFDVVMTQSGTAGAVGFGASTPETRWLESLALEPRCILSLRLVRRILQRLPRRSLLSLGVSGHELASPHCHPLQGCGRPL